MNIKLIASLTTRSVLSNSNWFNFKHTTRHASTLLRAQAKTETDKNGTTTVVDFADRLDNKTTPWLMLPPELDPSTGEKLDRFYSLSDSKIVKLNRKKSLKVSDTAKCIASTLGSWLGFVDTKDCSVYLSNPFSNDLVELPSLGTLPLVMGVERDSTGVVHFKVANDRSEDWDVAVFNEFCLIEPKSMAAYMSHLALSHEDPRHCDCVAMTFYGGLVYCKTNNNGTDDAIWYGLQEDDYPVTGRSYGLSLEQPEKHRLRDQIVYSSKTRLIYSLGYEGIQAFDVHRDRGRRTKNVALFKMEHIGKQIKEGLPKWLENLLGYEWYVEYYLLTVCNGDLWLIVRYLDGTGCNYERIYAHKTLHFDVFRVAYPGRLERLTNLEDRVIFIGSNQSFCTKAGGSPGIRPNCIYFANDYIDYGYNFNTNEHEYGQYLEIFCMKDRVTTQFYPYEDGEKEKNTSSPPTTPLFWIAPTFK